MAPNGGRDSPGGSFASQQSSLVEVSSMMARYGSCLAAFTFLVGTVYFDSSTAIWNQVYRTSMTAGGGAPCEQLWQRVEAGLDYGRRYQCRLKGPPSRSSAEELFKCLRSKERCSNMLTSELVKLLDNEQKLLEYGRSICDSSALEDADCSTMFGTILPDLKSSTWVASLVRRRPWSDFCAKKCGVCKEPGYSGWPDAGTSGVSFEGDSTAYWAWQKTGGFLYSLMPSFSDSGEGRDAASRGGGSVSAQGWEAADEVALSRRAWATGDWTYPSEDFGPFELDRAKARKVGAGGVYFSPELQDPQCPWFLVESRRVDRALFEWQDKEAKICGKSKQTPAECKASSRCTWLDDDHAPLHGEGAGCYFKTCDTAQGGRCYRRKAHAYGKAESLFVQSAFGLVLYWGLNYLLGGCEQFRRCFEFSELWRFAAVGSLFGASSLFAFLAQANLTPVAYMISGEASVVVIPLMWGAASRVPIPSLTWIHIVLVTAGILVYLAAELGDPGVVPEEVMQGVACVLVKVVLTGFACVTAERVDRAPQIPFLVQTAYIFAWKAVVCLAAVCALPPHRLPPSDVRFGGIFHDWNVWVLIVLGHGLCDTLFSALISPAFDGTVKAVCSVLGIVFPTLIVGYLACWERFNFGTADGKMKACGVVVVVLSAMAYVLGRAQTSELMSILREAADSQREDRQDRRGSLKPPEVGAHGAGIEMRTA